MNGLNFRTGVYSDLEELYQLERSIFGEDSYTRQELQFLLEDTSHSIVYVAENKNASSAPPIKEIKNKNSSKKAVRGYSDVLP